VLARQPQQRDGLQLWLQLNGTVCRSRLLPFVLTLEEASHDVDMGLGGPSAKVTLRLYCLVGDMFPRPYWHCHV